MLIYQRNSISRCTPTVDGENPTSMRLRGYKCTCENILLFLITSTVLGAAVQPDFTHKAALSDSLFKKFDLSVPLIDEFRMQPDCSVDIDAVLHPESVLRPCPGRRGDSKDSDTFLITALN